MNDRPLPAWRAAVVGSISVLLFLAGWEAACRAGLIDPIDFPAPSRVLSTAAEMAVVEDGRTSLFEHIGVSASRVLIGFLLSAVAGVPLGLVMGMSRIVRAALSPLVSILRPLPAMSWIPLSMIWIGIDETQKYFIVFVGCFASVLVYTTDATMRVDRTLIRAAQNLGASSLQTIRHVVLPGALPDVLSGLKVVLAIAWTCVISAELVGAESGLGWLIWTQKEFFATDRIVVGMLGISATVVVLDVLFHGLEVLLTPWRRREAGA